MFAFLFTLFSFQLWYSKDKKQINIPQLEIIVPKVFSGKTFNQYNEHNKT